MWTHSWNRYCIYRNQLILSVYFHGDTWWSPLWPKCVMCVCVYIYIHTNTWCIWYIIEQRSWEFNLSNQSYMHWNVNTIGTQSPTCFGTSSVPSCTIRAILKNVEFDGCIPSWIPVILVELFVIYSHQWNECLLKC